jgi:hypothetical protein
MKLSLLILKIQLDTIGFKMHNQNKRDWYYLNIEEIWKWKCETLFDWFWWLNIIQFIFIKMKDERWNSSNEFLFFTEFEFPEEFS